MPTTITGSDDVELTTSLSAPVDGDGGAAAQIRTMFQGVLDNTLKIAKHVVADFTALVDVDDCLDRERVYVVGYGLYEYRLADATALDSPWVVDGTGGRWHHVNKTLKGLNNGLAGLTSTGRVAQRPANAIVETYRLHSNTLGGGTSGSFADTSASHVISVANVEAGDRIQVVWGMRYAYITNGGQLRLIDTDSSISATCYADVVAGTTGYYTLTAEVRPTSTGTITIKSQYTISGGGGGIQANIGPVHAIATHIRP